MDCNVLLRCDEINLVGQLNEERRVRKDGRTYYFAVTGDVADLS